MTSPMADVKMIVFDVDGTLTDGGVYYGASGEEHKRFDIADGLGIRLAQCAGIAVAVISGRSSAAVSQRMSGLGVTEVMQGVGNKAVAMADLMRRGGLERHQIAFVGDDINDIPAFELAGVRIAVANAAEPLKARADYVTRARGGSGAGREAIETILREKNAYEDAVAAYLKEIEG